MTSILNNDGPTTYPTQPGHAVADHQTEMARATEEYMPPMPGVQYLSAPPRTDTTTIGQVQSTLDAVTNQFEKWLKTIRADDYTPDGLRSRISEFADTPAGRAIDDAVAIARFHRDGAQADIANVLRTLSPDGDTAAELRAGRYWNRTQRLLDSAKPEKLNVIASDLIHKATDAELGTLIQELAPYLRSRGIESDAWFEAALREKAPAYANAKKRATRAEKALQVTEHNVRALRQQINISAPAAYRRPRLVDARAYDPDR